MLTRLSLIALLTVTSTAFADDAAPKQTAARTIEPVDAPTRVEVKVQRNKRTYITHANAGIVAGNWTAANGAQPSKLTTLADRQTTVQMFGAGKFLAPNLRVTLSMQLAEYAGNGPQGASTLATVGAVPWVAYYPTNGKWFVGTGAVVAPRSYGKNQLDIGLFTTTGIAFPLGHGFAAGASVAVPVMLKVKTAVTAAPSTFVAYRF